MSINPSLASRRRGCLICGFVSDLADVNLRLFDAVGNRHLNGVRETMAYLRGIGMTGSERALEQRVRKHREHTEQYLAAHSEAPVVAPAMMGQVTRLDLDDATWLSLQQTGMNVTREAWALIRERLPEADFNGLVSLARLGSTIAAKRADLEHRGRIQRSHERMRIASGLSRADQEPT